MTSGYIICYQRLYKLQQITTSIQMSTHSRNDSLMKVNSVWEKLTGLLSLATAIYIF